MAEDRPLGQLFATATATEMAIATIENRMDSRSPKVNRTTFMRDRCP